MENRSGTRVAAPQDLSAGSADRVVELQGRKVEQFRSAIPLTPSRAGPATDEELQRPGRRVRLARCRLTRLPSPRGPTWSAVSPSAITRRLVLAARSPTMRETTPTGSVEGRPSRIPAARFAASASFVRCEMSRRSYCAALANMFATISPDAVDVSTPESSRTRRHPLPCARSSKPEKSCTERAGRGLRAGVARSSDGSLTELRVKLPANLWHDYTSKSMPPRFWGMLRCGSPRRGAARDAFLIGR